MRATPPVNLSRGVKAFLTQIDLSKFSEFLANLTAFLVKFDLIKSYCTGLYLYRSNPVPVPAGPSVQPVRATLRSARAAAPVPVGLRSLTLITLRLPVSTGINPSPSRRDSSRQPGPAGGSAAGHSGFAIGSVVARAWARRPTHRLAPRRRLRLGLAGAGREAGRSGRFRILIHRLDWHVQAQVASASHGGPPSRSLRVAWNGALHWQLEAATAGSGGRPGGGIASPHPPSWRGARLSRPGPRPSQTSSTGGSPGRGPAV